MEPRVLVSQCLLGLRCRYDSACAAKPEVCEAACLRGWIPVCPEILGGLCTPRSPAERCGNLVINRDGDDVTEQFRKGAEEALRLARLYGAKYALLKERSPSCGSDTIYDGSFTGRKIEGSGVTAELFRAAGIEVFGESRLQQLIDKIEEEKQHDPF